MIISRTPYRVSFLGGGSDIPRYYESHGLGQTISVAIRSYMYVTIRRRFEDNYRISYSVSECVKSIDDIEHSIIRECLRLSGIKDYLEITTIGDIPSGTGMGSSSTLAVGMLNALDAYSQGDQIKTHPTSLAERACHIELDILGSPIGKQDQFAAAYGGITCTTYRKSGVRVERIGSAIHASLHSHTLLFYTGSTRRADDILKLHNEDSDKLIDDILSLIGLGRGAFESNNIAGLGSLVQESWKSKSRLPGVTSDLIDAWVETALDFGAHGCKLLGAGGNGFLMVIAPPECHKAIRSGLKRPKELKFGIDCEGSSIVFNDQ